VNSRVPGLAATDTQPLLETTCEVEAVTVGFTKQELTLLSERAAAHGLTVLEFMRFAALCCPTSLEQPGWPSACPHEPPSNEAQHQPPEPGNASRKDV
jgi:hypothetical protein